MFLFLRIRFCKPVSSLRTSEDDCFHPCFRRGCDLTTYSVSVRLTDVNHVGTKEGSQVENNVSYSDEGDRNGKVSYGEKEMDTVCLAKSLATFQSYVMAVVKLFAYFQTNLPMYIQCYSSVIPFIINLLSNKHFVNYILMCTYQAVYK